MLTEGIIIAIIVQSAAIIIAILKMAYDFRQVKRDTKHAANEMRTNGGTTVKDQLNRIEERHAIYDERLQLLHDADVNDRAAAKIVHDQIYDKINQVASTVDRIKEDLEA